LRASRRITVRPATIIGDAEATQFAHIGATVRQIGSGMIVFVVVVMLTAAVGLFDLAAGVGLTELFSR
jgi:hypothetical protein